jgi:predicted transglutaminase-like cysteine proteinase
MFSLLAAVASQISFSGTLTAQWSDLLIRINSDLAIAQTCTATACPDTAKRLLQMAVEAKISQSPVGITNRLVNMSVTYKQDWQIYGTPHWASPLETLEHKEANCVGQAVLKAAVAILAGVDPQRFKLALVEGMPVGHAVLLYRSDSGWTVLDNNTLLQKPREKYQGIRVELAFAGSNVQGREPPDHPSSWHEP